MATESAIRMEDRPHSYPPEKWRRLTRYQRLRVLVFERDGYTCRHCDLYLPGGEPLTVAWEGHRPIRRWLQLDHIIPTSKGGDTTLANSQALCNVCNARKGDCVRPNGPVGWSALLSPVSAYLVGVG